MTNSEFVDELTAKMKGLTSLFTSDDYDNSITDMSRETGWTFPMTDSFELYWASQRCRRHLFFYLLTQQAHKFQVEQLHLEQRFDHYKSVIDTMDEEFKEAKEERPEKFTDAEVYLCFGSYITSGFSYDAVGNDDTYSDEDTVQHFPTS